MENVGEVANPVAQTIVEAMRSATGAEIGMLGAAFFDESVQFPAGSLSVDSLLKAVRYPEDEVVVLSLTGEQLLQALERSIELYPQKNNAFLQLTGAEVRFDPKAEPGNLEQGTDQHQHRTLYRRGGARVSPASAHPHPSTRLDQRIRV
jgi:5'-nucleotidase/UDP-sugar diphosphatase